MAEVRPVGRKTRVLALLGALLLSLALGCASNDIPDFEDVAPADELYAKGNKILEGHNILWVYTWVNHTKAIETFQSIVDNYPYSDFEVQAQLKIADAYYDSKRYDEALSYYRDFGDLHPRHEEVPYTILRSALCYYNQIESIDRDQTATRESIGYLELLIRKYPYAPQTRRAEELLRELRTRLALNTMQVANFYLVRTQWPSAAARFRRVLNDYPGLGLDAEALYKLAICYENMQRLDEALRLYHVVVENYRRTDSARGAAERIAAAN